MDETQVVTVLPDWGAVRLGDMPDLAPVTLEKAVQRVLPRLGPPVETVKVRGAFFNSSV